MDFSSWDFVLVFSYNRASDIGFTELNVSLIHFVLIIHFASRNRENFLMAQLILLLRCRC